MCWGPGRDGGNQPGVPQGQPGGAGTSGQVAKTVSLGLIWPLWFGLVESCLLQLSIAVFLVLNCPGLSLVSFFISTYDMIYDKDNASHLPMIP